MGKAMTVAEIQELVPTLAVTIEPVGRLQEYAGNAKEHTAEGKSEVVEGHGRLMAALELGLQSVPVIHLDGLSDEQRRFYALVHNKLTMNTGWDFDKLNSEIDSLADVDMCEFGFEDGFDAIQDLLEDDFVSLKDEADAEFYNITFTFPAETKKAVKAWLDDAGKEQAVAMIVNAAQAWG